MCTDYSRTVACPSHMISLKIVLGILGCDILKSGKSLLVIDFLIKSLKKIIIINNNGIN